MIANTAPASAITHGALPDPRLLAICGSMKPAPGQDQPSACRTLLHAAMGIVGRVFPAIDLMDLRDEALPPFQGLDPMDHPHPGVRHCHARIAAASGLVLSVPAYWGGVGGTFKSFVETVSGPAYSAGARSPFAGRPVVALIVGADAASAAAAAEQLPVILHCLGARQAGPFVVVDDPAAAGMAQRAIQGLVVATAGLARDVATAATVAS
ncbi:NAD(P)H-dependent oxidoreductase [Tistrella bauzanensis]|uniref:NAD(P)H-dependent oxidoreductase n=1 Tax=Tistrella TaxID=171436 RepID=UPI0031F62A6B